MPRIIPIRDLKNTTEISKMCNESPEPVYITKNGYGDMVIMGMKAYEEKMYMLDVYYRLAQAEEEIHEGQAIDARKALKKLEGEIWLIKLRLHLWPIKTWKKFLTIF